MLSDQEIAKVKKYLNGKDQNLAETFKLLSDPNRCKMFRALAKHKQISVSDAANILDISLPLASQHLKILYQGDLLAKKKEGQSVYYSLNEHNPFVDSILRAIN